MSAQSTAEPVGAQMPGDAMTRVIVISFVLHLFFLVGLPLIMRALRKPVKFERPQTFQLVRPPVLPKSTPRPKQQVKPRPAPEKPKEPVPAKQRVAPAETKPEPVKENTEELADLLGEIETPPAQVASVGSFKYHWYLNSVQQKVERFWRPPSASRDVAVLVSFVIHSDGSASEPSISKSSGNSVLDNLALRAVKLASPFGRLPPGFSEDRIELTCTFRPIGR